MHKIICFLLKHVKMFKDFRYLLVAIVAATYFYSLSKLLFNNASVQSVLWFTFVFIVLCAIILNTFLKKEGHNIDLVNLFSIIVAGLLAVQLNQPLFVPTVSEIKITGDAIESFIDLDESSIFNAKIDNYQYSSFEITVLPPLFPFSNNIPTLYGEKNNLSDVNSTITELRGPIEKAEVDKEIRYTTTVDGFSVKSAKIFGKTTTIVPHRNDLGVSVGCMGGLDWAHLDDGMLSFFSQHIFSNRVHLKNYLNDKFYKNRIDLDYKLNIDGNTISVGIDGPDFYELDVCKLAISNRTNQEQKVMFRKKGMYRREYYAIDTLENNRRHEIKKLSDMEIHISPLKSTVIYIVELKSRRLFDEIYPQ